MQWSIKNPGAGVEFESPHCRCSLNLKAFWKVYNKTLEDGELENQVGVGKRSGTLQPIESKRLSENRSHDWPRFADEETETLGMSTSCPALPRAGVSAGKRNEVPSRPAWGLTLQEAAALVEGVAGPVLVQRMLVHGGRLAEPWMRPAAIPGREDRPRQPGHEVHLPRVGDGLQSRDFVHPVQGRRLGLPRGADAPLVRPAFRGPTAPKAEPSGASQRQPGGPRRQRHACRLALLKTSTRTPPSSRAQGLLGTKGAGRRASSCEWQPIEPIKARHPCLAPPSGAGTGRILR